MKRSMKSTLAAFSSQRMVKEYAELGVSETGESELERVLRSPRLDSVCRLRDQQHLARRLATL